jgi:hypothetical protein
MQIATHLMANSTFATATSPPMQELNAKFAVKLQEWKSQAADRRADYPPATDIVICLG